MANFAHFRRPLLRPTVDALGQAIGAKNTSAMPAMVFPFGHVELQMATVAVVGIILRKKDVISKDVIA